jgi:hypothetical protein
MLESITVFKTVVKGCGDQLEQPVTLKEIVDAYNFDAMKKGLSSIGEEDIGDRPVMPVALGLYRFHIKAASVKVWVVKAPNKKIDIVPLAQRLDNESLTYRNHQNDVEQGLCPEGATAGLQETVYLWNGHPQLACLKTLEAYNPQDSHPYKARLYGQLIGFQHCCPQEHGHPARDLIRELRGLFPKEQYGSSVLNLGQAAILLRWASSLPVVFRDGTEEVVRMSIQDGVIVIEQA